LYRLGDKNKAETVIPFDIRNLKSGGTTVQVHVDSVYGPGGSEAFAKYIVQTVKRGQSSGRVEKWGA
jgi:glycerol-3-phosphate responsive antiterminator